MEFDEVQQRIGAGERKVEVVFISTGVDGGQKDRYRVNDSA